MQQTYHIKPSEFNISFFQAIKELLKNEEEVTITVSSERKLPREVAPIDEKEKLFYSLFGSWEGNETGDELVEKIYSARVSSNHEIEL
jgi:hypothetical protein